MQSVTVSGGGFVGAPALSEQVALDVLWRFDSLAVSPLARDQPIYHLGKRVLDLVLGIVALVVLAPVMAIVALAVAVDSRGSVIFRQKRVGGQRWTARGYSYWQRREFTCYKFRTMVQDADPAVHQKYIADLICDQVAASEDGTAKYKIPCDPRITRVGRFLRKTSLDELPQLINVIRGEMSLVGPRPDLPYAVKMYRPEWHERLAALPGITGAWQVSGRADVSYTDMIQMDIQYVRERSLALDLRVLALTAPAVIAHRGAA